MTIFIKIYKNDFKIFYCSFIVNLRIMHLRTLLSFVMFWILACAPNVRITETYKSNQKKIAEVIKGEGSTAKVVKRIEYYLNGQVKSEANISNEKLNGEYLSFYSNGLVYQKGQFKAGKEKGKWTYFNTRGQIDSIHTYKEGLLDGETKYNVYGKLIINQEYKSGKKNGAFVEYYTDGNKKVAGSYLMNLPNNEWTWYDLKEAKTRQINFKNGLKDGDFRVWKDTDLYLVGVFDKDKKTGTWKWHRTKKDLDSLVTYVNGEINGFYEAWYQNGISSVKGSFETGVPIGKWEWFSENNTLDSTKTFKNGLLNGISTFHFKNGQIKRSVNYVSDILHGENKSFFISGQVKDKTTYMSGQKSGPYEVWNASSNPEEKGLFLNNELHGEVQRWYSSGIPASITSYNAGILDGAMQVYSLSKQLKRELFYNKGKEIARFEYHDNGRFKRVVILDETEVLYERKWNKSGVEETEEKYIIGTRLDNQFYLSGSIKYECIYKNKNKHGMEWWFSEDRKPTRVNLYLNGLKIINHKLYYETNE